MNGDHAVLGDAGAIGPSWWPPEAPAERAVLVKSKLWPGASVAISAPPLRPQTVAFNKTNAVQSSNIFPQFGPTRQRHSLSPLSLHRPALQPRSSKADFMRMRS